MTDRKRFKFHISPPEDSHMKGKVSFGEDSIDFSISDTSGDDVTDLISTIWSFMPDMDESTLKYQWCFDDKALPCDKLVIGDEDDRVVLTVKNFLRGKKRMLRVDINCEGDRTRRHLSGTVGFFEFADAIGGAVDSMLDGCGLMSYCKHWSRPFPLMKYLAVKSLLTRRLLSNYKDEVWLMLNKFRSVRMNRPIKKITLDSKAHQVGLETGRGNIVRQLITITSHGKVYISLYDASGALVDRRIQTVDELDAEEVIEDIVDYIELKGDDFHVSNVGSWRLTVTDASDKKHKFDGSLYYAPGDWLQEFSKKMRAYLGRWDLFVFDGNARPAADGIMFCSCEFYRSAKTYYYISEDYTLKEGDYVRVPVGNHGRVKTARIVDIEYFKEDEVPMPLDSVKKIIERADGLDDAE